MRHTKQAKNCVTPFFAKDPKNNGVFDSSEVMRLRKKYSLSKRILSVMRADPKTEYNAVTIYRILYKKMGCLPAQRKLAVKQIRKELMRLVKRGMVINSQKGYYCLRISAKTLHLLDNPPVVCHGIKIEATMTNVGSPQNSILGITSNDPKKNINEWLALMNFSEATKKRWVKRFFWEGRFITITLHPACGLVELWIKCSENPMDFSAMYRFKEYISGFLSPVCDFSDARVREIGINKDFRELRLEGVSSLSLRVFMNAWSRIYYKETIGAVRVEQHWVGSISFHDVVELIGRINAPVIRERVGRPDKWVDEVMFG